MSCTFDKELLTGFYDGELDGSEKAQVESHISACSECLRDLSEIKSTAILVRELPRGRAPRSIADGVSREIASSGRVHSMGRFRRGLFWATSAAAALLIGLNIVYFGTRWGGADAPMTMAKQPPAESAISKAGGYREAEERAGNVAQQQAEQADFKGAKLKEMARKDAPADRAAVDNKKLAGGRLEAPAKDKAPAPTAEPAPESKSVAKAETRPQSAAPPKPAAAAPRPKMARKPSAPAPSAAPPPAPARRAVGKAAPDALKKNAEEKEKAASLDEAARQKSALTKSDDALRDAEGAAPAAEYLVVATDAAAVRRAIEATIQKWGVAPVRKETEKDLLTQKFRKLQTEPSSGPLELHLTDAQLAALTKSLGGMKQVVVEPVPAEKQGQRLAAGTRGSKRYTPPAESPVPQPKPEAKKSVASRNRAAEADAAKAEGFAPGVAAKGKSAPLRRVIFHFRSK